MALAACGCCREGGLTCLIRTVSACTDDSLGVFLGPGTDCTPNPCDLSSGACCFETTACVVASASQCSEQGGVWQGVDTTCEPENPCAPHIGACCFDDGTCVVGDEGDCHGGIYKGDGTTCEPDPCVNLGACCVEGVCFYTDQPSCEIGLGEFLGAGTDCAPDPCEGGEGACCVDIRTCIVTTESGCAAELGSYLGDGTTCEPENPCAGYGGACCLPEGGCLIGFAPDCVLLEGSYQGDGTSCEPDPCPTPPGACCFEDGTCQQLPLEDCHGGEFLGQGTVCEPNPCEASPNTGACCTWLDGCVMTSPEACFGEFGGIGSPCVDCPDILIEGIWDCIFEVLEDQNPPHDSFVGGRNIHSFTFAGTGNALGATGAAPFVHSKGTISQFGAFVLEGTGTVAGRPNVNVRFSGTIAAREQGGGWFLEGEYRFGNTTAPFQLPNGPITYSVQATSM